MTLEALSLTRYLHDKEFNSKAFTRHLAMLATESNVDLPLVKRINSFELTLLPNGGIVDLKIDNRDVISHYSPESQETIAALKMRNVLASEPENTVAIWLSPPGGPLKYPEGRLTVGINKVIKGTKIAKSYGIPIYFTPNECLLSAWRLAEFSNRDFKLDNPEDLRTEVIIIEPQNGIDPFDILRQGVPLDEVWNVIESGSVEKNMQEIYDIAEEIYPQVDMLIQTAKTPSDFIRAGAHAERLMFQKGKPIQEGPCGLTNTGILNSLATQFFSFTTLDKKGQIISIKIEGQKTLCCTCPFCNKKVEAQIHGGKIHCPKCGKSANWSN